MGSTIVRYADHLKKSARTALLGPQLLAFLPAMMLVGYWFGGEAMLMFMAIMLPGLLGLVGMFTPVTPQRGGTLGPVDPITHLPMRERLEAALEGFFAEEAATGLRTATMAIEIDDFATIQRDHGDRAADRVLIEVAKRLTTTLRDADVICRPEGGLFLVAMAPARRADLESMIQISARIQSAIAEPIMADGLRLFLTASIGFCVPRRASEKNADHCLEAAEAALCEAQATGAAAIRAYSAQPRRKRVIRSGLVAEVEAALEDGQIRPWFQPQLSCDTGEITGVEALARWQHPTRGVILPGAFLPAVSAAGATGRLGEIILYYTLSALRDWDAAGESVPSAGVNFSPEDLSDPTLCDKIRWELDRFELEPRRLTIEVLETVIARSENDTITRNLAQLAGLGCPIDLDDFGTGHASIANIRRFSVNRIKIDRSFICSIDTDRQQQQMLTAILEMASRLDIETLAEGVESAGEHTLLAQLGCDYVQGYHIAPPMPFDEVSNWLAAHRRTLASQPRIAGPSGA